MGQIQDAIMASPRVAFDEKGNNGLIIAGKYIPAEVLAEIFCHADLKVLLNCQLVCKRWKMFIQSYLWRKKAEMTLGKPFPRDENIPWNTFYLICKKKPFERNLLKNHSGEYGQKYWQILSQGGDHWIVERPPVGVPELPLDPVFEGKQSCFVTSFQSCIKIQEVDLLAEGFTPYILDVLQPPIEMSEWYSCRWDCPAIYECQVKLLKDENDETEGILDIFHMRDDIEGEKQNQWLHVSHIFENYGPGLRKISFSHGGMDKSFWKGHYGSKMAGACIYVKVPPFHYTYNDEVDIPPILNE